MAGVSKDQKRCGKKPKRSFGGRPSWKSWIKFVNYDIKSSKFNKPRVKTFAILSGWSTKKWSLIYFYCFFWYSYFALNVANGLQGFLALFRARFPKFKHNLWKRQWLHFGWEFRKCDFKNTLLHCVPNFKLSSQLPFV